MADLADVENALLSVLAGALFNLPLQTEGGLVLTDDSGNQLLSDDGSGYVPPASAATTGGIQTRLYRGWPTPTGLLNDLRDGVSQVSVFAGPGMIRNTTRYIETQFAQTGPAPTLIIATHVRGQATVNGTPAVGQVCGILLGDPGAGIGYAYRVLAGDTCATIAAALAAIIPGATASGVIITLPAFAPAIGRVVQDGTSYREVRRQDQVFRISVWAPSHDARDALAALCDLALAPMTRITLLTGETLYQRYAGTRVDDVPTRNEAWLRELTYCVEYPTNIIAAAPSMLFGAVSINTVAAISG